MSNFQRQLMLKNLKNIPKLLLEENSVNEAIATLAISELRSVKGFGDTTVTKLTEKGIDTVQKLKKAIDECGDDKTKTQAFLTPPQLKQFQTHLAENPLLVEDVV